MLNDSQQLPGFYDFINRQNAQVFYFLETPERGGKGMISVLDTELAKLYTPLCRTPMIYSHVIKFGKQKPVLVDWDRLPDCIQ
jgi:hypothetical protein